MKVLNKSQKSKEIPNSNSDMGRQFQETYRFKAFRLDPSERTLFRRGQSITLAAKTFDMLLLLIRQRAKLVTKKHLLDQLWPDAFVDEANLSTHVARLRKALGEGPKTEHFIQTVPKHGYRFVAKVRTVIDDQLNSRSADGRGAQKLIESFHPTAFAVGSDGVADYCQEASASELNKPILSRRGRIERVRVIALQHMPNSDVVVLICKRLK